MTPEIDSRMEGLYAMDARHIAALRAALGACDGMAAAMEIGCHMGHSTAAFFDALAAAEHPFDLHLVDLVFTPEVMGLQAGCPRKERVFLHKDRGRDCLFPVDFVLIDGDHGTEALVELALALALRIPTIALHDTAAELHGHPDCFGSRLAGNILRQAVAYECVEDRKLRLHELTHRGFMIASTVPAVARAARACLG